MTKADLLKIVNAVLFISFITQFITIIMILFGIMSSEIGTIVKIHNYNGLVFCALVITHVILNWGWIKATFLTRRK